MHMKPELIRPDVEQYAISSHTPGMARGDPSTNTVLLACLEQIRPAGFMDHTWAKHAELSHNLFCNMRQGKVPSVYNLERVVTAAGKHVTVLGDH